MLNSVNNIIKRLQVWLERVLINTLYSAPVIKNFGVRMLRQLGWTIKDLHVRENAVYELTDGQDEKIFFARRGRVRRYRHGVNWKLRNLQAEYLSGELELNRDSIVIDIGANVGEFSKFWMDKGHRVVAFEPDPIEYKVLEYNNPSGTNYNVGLWEKNDVLRFYLNNDSGDSSLLPESENEHCIELEVKKLDDFGLEKEDIGLIKLEAEGAEPEIIKGGLKVVGGARYVSVDVGEERGVNKESTLVDVLALVVPMGFEVIAYNPKRQSLLFKKVSRQKRSKDLIQNQGHDL